VDEAAPEPMIAALRKAMEQMGSTVPVTGLAFMDERIADTLSVERSVTSALSAFSLLAVLLAAVGLYGVVAQWVAQRTAELGLRLALGATRRQLLSMILRHALLLTGAGAAWGLLLAAAATRIITTQVSDAGPFNPTVFAAAALLLAVVALAASCVPALRAASVDPLTALRSN
jgi:ABC-type antimicrobial peptide transport system permease subunit